MEKKNPNIYQRALDIVNNRINPDIPQGGGGGSSDAVQYIPQTLTEAQQMQARKNQGLYYEIIDTFTWDGDTTDLDCIMGAFYRVPAFENVDPNGVLQFTVYFNGECTTIDSAEMVDISAGVGADDGTIIMAMTDSEMQWFVVFTKDVDIDIGEGFRHYKKGCYSIYTEDTGYVSSITEEVVHQIDQKYIPDSEFTVVIDYNSIGSDTQAAYDEALAAFQAKKNVLFKKGDVSIPMTGYDSEHCFFGGTASAYLPGNIINAVYAHVGPNGNKFWWGYTIPLGANALSIADEDEHFTGTNVESALAELASRLDALESK